MKQRIDSATLGFLAFLLVLSGSCLMGFSAAEGGVGAVSAKPGPPPLSLDDAVRLALEHNPELRALGWHVDAADGRAYQAKLWTNPELTLDVEDWPVNDGDGYSDSKQTVGVAQTIPYPGKKKLDRQIGASGVRLSEAELILRRRELVRDVKGAFYQVLAAERLLEVAGELVTVAESSASTASRRVAAGAAADQELLRTEIPLEQARTEVSGFEKDLVEARESLAMLLGRPDLREAPVSGRLADTVDVKLLEDGTGQWLTNHPGLRMVRSIRERAELELRRAGLEPYPDVRVGVSGGQIGETGHSIVEFGVSLPLPIIDRSKGRKQEARANVRIAEAEQIAVEHRLLRSWGVAKNRLRAALEQVTNYRERILPKAEEALRLVQAGFEEGKFGFMDLLDTQRTTAEARLAYQRKLLELNVAQAELESLARDDISSQAKNSQP